MAAYYNENDKQIAAWLRELIKLKLIAAGDVDDRSILEVSPHELTKYTQHHFFAGIGGWSYALRLAGWPDSRPVLTGSPPCQPFSAAGKQLGVKDERHLAPKFLELVTALRHSVLFGEQVAAAATKDGWLDDLLDVLEAEGYATGAAVLPAASVGSPHIRQRIYFAGVLRVGNAYKPGLEGYSGDGNVSRQEEPLRPAAEAGSGPRAADSNAMHSGISRDASAATSQGSKHWDDFRDGSPSDLWEAVEWASCGENQFRPLQPGCQPLAHGIPSRVVRVRGYGNAIVPQLAAEVIRSVM